MTGRSLDAIAARSAVVVVFTVLLCGCATLRPKWMDREPEARVAPEPPAVAQPTDKTEQEVLTAIEEFLERTQEYQFGNPTPSFARESSPGSTSARPASATTSGETDNAPVNTGPASAGLPAWPDEAFANTQVVLASTQATAAPRPALPVVQSVSIRSVPSTESPQAPPVKMKTTNEPLGMQQPEMPGLVDRLISYLKTRAAEANDLDSEWRLRFAQLAVQHDADATQVSTSLPQEERRILSALIEVAVAVREAARNPLAVGSTALSRIDELREVLADRADPVVTTVALCRKVVTFGVYEEMADDDLVSGRTSQTIVYSEIRNFRSELTDDDQYRTRLATRLEILTADGRSVWQHEEPDITDLCQRRRADFFVAQRITLPPTLPAGDYVLKVLVEDKLSGRASETSHPFVMRSAIAVSSGF
ncbi:MAG: hypothetical protein JSU86_19755 [Phycisphaerales bacterium]|nr:MAG: hypothetical protein JSU86_19755 [Phycisphaerales bacterium]